jgi:hypothetical protein
VDDIYLFLEIVMTGLAGLLFLVSSVSWYRLKALKLGLISLAFFLLMCKGFLLIFEVIKEDSFAVFIDVFIVIVLYFSMIKK